MNAEGSRRAMGTAGGLVAAAAAVATALATAPAGLEAQTWGDMQFARQVQAERALAVQVSYGAGTVRLGPADARHLYQARIRFDEEAFQPIHEYRDGRLRIGVEGTGRRTTLRRLEGAGELELRLSRSVPMELILELGAVKAELDFGGLQLRILQLTTGASDTDLRVSAPNPMAMDSVRLQVGAASLRARELGNLNAREIRVDAGVGDVRLDLGPLLRTETDVRVSMGLGSVEIRVPRGVGVRLSRSTLLTSINAPGLTREGDVWLSPEWGRVDRQVRIHVDAALGSISVLRSGPD